MKKNRVISIIVFIAYVMLISMMFFFHENWRDEAQAYLLCRDMNFAELLKNIHYEGHPFLYYLLLFPFIKLGAGVKIINIFSIVFMSIAVYLILFKSKLNLIQKICIIVTYPIMYEFSVIGRSYSLIFLLLVCYALIYKNRFKYPCLYMFFLGLLLNTHLMLAGFVGINVLIFYIDVFSKFNDKSHKKKNNRKFIYHNILFNNFVFAIL